MSDLETARLALDVIRTSSLGGLCTHPAEALEYDEARCHHRCVVCTVLVTDDDLARVDSDPDAGRVTYRDRPLPRGLWRL